MLTDLFAHMVTHIVTHYHEGVAIDNLAVLQATVQRSLARVSLGINTSVNQDEAVTKPLTYSDFFYNVPRTRLLRAG